MKMCTFLPEKKKRDWVNFILLAMTIFVSDKKLRIKLLHGCVFKVLKGNNFCGIFMFVSGITWMCF